MAAPTSPQPITTASTANGGPHLVEPLYNSGGRTIGFIDLIINGR